MTKRRWGGYIAQRCGNGAYTRKKRPRDYRKMRRKLRAQGRATGREGK